MAQNELSADLLYGASAISDFIWGAENPRRVYHLCEHGNLPVFRLGNVICGRKSTLLDHIKAQEGELGHDPSAAPK